MFELARQYRDKGMAAYSALQEKEFASEREYGYQAVKHQRFVGTGYFDQVQQVISGGLASTTALEGSTEAEQFSPGVKRLKSSKKASPLTAGLKSDLQERFPEMPQEEMLQPSGD
jgi:hypothetical protein